MSLGVSRGFTRDQLISFSSGIFVGTLNRTKLKNKLQALALLSAFIAAPVMAGDSGPFVEVDYSAVTMSNTSANVTQPSGGVRLLAATIVKLQVVNKGGQ